MQPYIWRSLPNAPNGDRICVTDARRRELLAENQAHHSLVDPNNQHSGPNTCINGYKWRDAFPGDEICVNEASKMQTAADNANHRGRTVVGASP
jgi:hypothetical protein